MLNRLIALLLLTVSCRASVEVIEEQLTPTRWQISIQNTEPYTISVRTQITTADNAYVTHPDQGDYIVGEEKWTIIAPGETVPVLIVGPDTTPGSWEWYWLWEWYQGTVQFTPVTDEHHIYRLPYDGSYTVSSALKNYSPFGAPPENWHMAVDWPMDEGTPILAARAGTVVQLKEDSNINGYTEDVADDGNFIEIEHDDGTFSVYYHLEQNGAAVVIGQSVNEGEFIGYSGNTGYSSGPHLHLHVWYLDYNAGSPIPVQIPIRFYSQEGYGFLPAPGESFVAVDSPKIPSKEAGTFTGDGNHFHLTRRVPIGIISTLWRSHDLESGWTPLQDFTGTNATETFSEAYPTSPWENTFYRWSDSYESLDDYPEPE